MNSFFGKEYTKDQFKNKFNQLKGKCKDFTNLIKMETRLGYNSTTEQIVTIDDEWKKLCEVCFNLILCLYGILLMIIV